MSGPSRSFRWIQLESSENPGESSIRRPWAHPATLRWFWPRDGAHGWCPIRMRCLRLGSWEVGGNDLGVTGENVTSCGCWNDLRVTPLNSLYGSLRVWSPKVTCKYWSSIIHSTRHQNCSMRNTQKLDWSEIKRSCILQISKNWSSGKNGKPQKKEGMLEMKTWRFSIS